MLVTNVVLIETFPYLQFVVDSTVKNTHRYINYNV